MRVLPVPAFLPFQPVDVRDIPMVERGEELRVALETSETVNVGGEELRQDFQRDVATELRVARAVDLAHPAGPEGGQNFVRTEASAGGQCHAAPVILSLKAGQPRAEVADGDDVDARPRPIRLFSRIDHQ